mmetsp:Transcript_54055/g.127706  ORF Transcript_54055/g.127706 Transcript_54055/m.127706 type:complete len:246 (-) Transcript_54055:216-953(-)
MLLKMRRAQLLCKIKQQNQLLHPKRSQLRQRTKLLRRISLITLAGKGRGAASLLNPKPNGIRHPRDRSREDRRLRPPALHGVKRREKKTVLLLSRLRQRSKKQSRLQETMRCLWTHLLNRRKRSWSPLTRHQQQSIRTLRAVKVNPQQSHPCQRRPTLPSNPQLSPHLRRYQQATNRRRKTLKCLRRSQSLPRLPRRRRKAAKVTQRKLPQPKRRTRPRQRRDPTQAEQASRHLSSSQSFPQLLE